MVLIRQFLITSGKVTVQEDAPLTIAAVIPAYQRERTIERAIRSALEQTRAPDELIVVDDGSTDGTRSIVDTFGSQVVYHYQANQGAAAARNTGIELASSRWIAFLDSDDYWLPHHLERIEAAIHSTRGEAAVYFCNVEYDRSRPLRHLWEAARLPTIERYALQQPPVDWTWLPIQPFMLQGSVFRRELLQQVGGLNTDLEVREDTHLFMILGAIAPFCAVNEIGTVMRDDADDRLTRKSAAQQRRYVLSSRALYEDIARRDLPLPRTHRDELDRRRADAELRCARIAWNERNPAACARHGWLAITRSPQYMLRRASRRLASSIRSTITGGTREPTGFD